MTTVLMPGQPGTRPARSELPRVGAMLQPMRHDRLTAMHVALAAFMGALGVWAMFPSWREIYHMASGDEEWSHIFIVPLVALYLVWVRRMRLRHCKPSGRIVGPLIVLAGWIIGSIGFYWGIQSFWHGGAVLVALGCVLSVLGKNVIFRFFPAIAVLVFLVPVPGRLRLAIANPLEQWTANIAYQLLDAIGTSDTSLYGNQIRIHGQPVNVAEACNGIRMVFALILVSFAFGFSMPLRNSVRILILLASPIVSIVCNVIRTLPTIWFYGLSDHWRWLSDGFHAVAGWMMLPLAFGILYAIIQLLKWAMIPVTSYTLASQ